MADKPVGEVVAVDAVLDGLSSPTSSDVYEAMQPFSNDAVGAVAAKRALAGGGGGGSLPNNWTASEDGSVTVNDGAEEGGTDYFILTASEMETFSKFLRVYNLLTLDDAPMVATNDNGDTLFEIDPAANGGDGEVSVSGVPFSSAAPTLAAVIAAGNTAGGAIASVTDPTNAQDAATKASAQAQADAAEQNAKDYAGSLSTGWQTGTGIHLLQGATAGVLVNDADTFYSWAVDANKLVTVNFGVTLAEGTETSGVIVVGFPDLPLGITPIFNRSGALGCLIGGTEYNLFADISGWNPEVTIVPANVPSITDPLLVADRIAGMFSYRAAA